MGHSFILKFAWSSQPLDELNPNIFSLDGSHSVKNGVIRKIKGRLVRAKENERTKCWATYCRRWKKSTVKISPEVPEQVSRASTSLSSVVDELACCTSESISTVGGGDSSVTCDLVETFVAKVNIEDWRWDFTLVLLPGILIHYDPPSPANLIWKMILELSDHFSNLNSFDPSPQFMIFQKYSILSNY